MKQKLLGLFLGILAFSFFSCGPKEVSVPIIQVKKLPEIEKVSIKEGWEVEWDHMQKEARKEGKVVIYTPVGPEVRQVLAEGLKEYGLTVESVSGRGIELAERILRERRGGINYVDIFIAGPDTVQTVKPAGVLAPLEPLLLLPEVKDPNLWYKGKLPFIDKDKLIIVFDAYLDPGIHINTDIVKPEDIKYVRDLLAPRWEGKIIIDDPTVAGRGRRWLTIVTLMLGEDLVKELAKHKPVITRDIRQLIDWIAKGRTPIGIGVYPEYYMEYRRAGAPVINHPIGEVSYLLGGNSHIVYMDKAPHPNASRVFINWLLSKKGQMLWQKVRHVQSSRIDVPADHLKDSGQPIRLPGIDYYDARSETFVMEIEPKAREFVMDTFRAIIR